MLDVTPVVIRHGSQATLIKSDTRSLCVTDTGCARYVTLCQVHGPRARVAVGIPYRWARSPRDQRSHLLAQRDTDQIGGQVAVCGQRLWWSVAMSAQPTGRPCLTCEALSGVLVPASRFDSPPDSGRPPVEQLPWPRGHQPAFEVSWMLVHLPAP